MRPGALIGVLAIIAALAPNIAGAKVPSPANSTMPSHILLVGEDAQGQADPIGAITFVLRDLANVPERQSTVRLYFPDTPDLEPSMVQPDPNVSTVFCDGGGRYVEAITNDQGSVTLRVVGRALRSAAGTHDRWAMRLFGDGVLLSNATVSAVDEDGVGGVGPADLSDFLDDFFSGQYWARSDFDGDGALGPNDLSVWVRVFFGPGSVLSGSTAACP